jgi:predicted RNA-binding protein with PUA-like domain
MACWLFKTEPDVFSIHDLKARGPQGEIWDGVRNYQARNMLRDQVRAGDRIFIYHSNCEVPGVAGVATAIDTGVIDPTQFNPDSQYHDPTSDPTKPRWITVKVGHVETLPSTISLGAIKAHPGLADMQLVKKGNRLSILPVTEDQWAMILSLQS